MRIRWVEVVPNTGRSEIHGWHVEGAIHSLRSSALRPSISFFTMVDRHQLYKRKTQEEDEGKDEERGEGGRERGREGRRGRREEGGRENENCIRSDTESLAWLVHKVRTRVSNSSRDPPNCPTYITESPTSWKSPRFCVTRDCCLSGSSVTAACFVWVYCRSFYRPAGFCLHRWKR